MLDQLATIGIFQDLTKIAQLIQKMCEIHQVYFLAYQKSLHQNLDNSIYIILIFFDQSSLISQSYKVLNISTMSNKHQAIFKAFH
jgi:hypothetical protein